MGLQGKTTLADYAIVKRIHLIYERATRKFRGDLRVWLKWLHFCRTSGSTRQISRVHPPCTSVMKLMLLHCICGFVSPQSCFLVDLTSEHDSSKQTICRSQTCSRLLPSPTLSVMEDVTIATSQSANVRVCCLHALDMAHCPLSFHPTLLMQFSQSRKTQAYMFTGVDKGPTAASCCLWAVELCCCLGV